LACHSPEHLPRTPPTRGVHTRSQSLLTAARTTAALGACREAGKKNDDAIFGRNIMPFTVALTVESETIDTQSITNDRYFKILDETVLEVITPGCPANSRVSGIADVVWHDGAHLAKGRHAADRAARRKAEHGQTVTFMLIRL
jgi:hypothetical protein